MSKIDFEIRSYFKIRKSVGYLITIMVLNRIKKGILILLIHLHLRLKNLNYTIICYFVFVILYFARHQYLNSHLAIDKAHEIISDNLNQEAKNKLHQQQ